MAKTPVKVNKRKKRVGRGGARGKNAGRGHKGQKSRAGRNIRPAIRDELQRIPKRRGHNKNRARGVRNKKAVRSVTLRILEKNFIKNEMVTPKILVTKKIITRVSGAIPQVKIVATGEITIPLTIQKCILSVNAKQKVEAAKGVVK